VDVAEETLACSTRWRKAAPLLAFVLVRVYATGAHFHIQRVNTEIVKADQGAYVAYARQMSLTHYAHVGGRNQMPVLPFLASLVDRPEDSVEELFIRAKYMNVGLSLVVLACVWWLLRHTLPSYESTALIAIVAFTVYVYRAGYVQAELLFYGLFFLSFVLALSLLRRPGWGRAAACGVVLGIAYLTKAAVLPLLAAFVFWSIVGVVARSSKQRPRLLPLAATTLVVVIFLATVFPYIQNSHERFGYWFYNVNTSIYMWADSWDEVKRVMRGTGDREHWPDLPADEIPSPSRYFSEHSVGDIAARLVSGLWTSEIRHLVYKPFGYGKYLIFYFLVALALTIRSWRAVVEVCFANGRWVETAFALSVIVGYVVAYAFYSPIVRGPRLVLALYLPTLFSIFWLLTRDGIAGLSVWEGRRFQLGLPHVHAAALVVLATDIVFRFPHVIVTAFAGA
ncbi:MAG: hypothetical protein GY944_12570, partial [bacterium]|nr:hypothetical protein [bacterium]